MVERGWEGKEAGNRKSDRDESEHGRGGQRADDAPTVTNPQTFQVENISLIWESISPSPHTKAAQVICSINVNVIMCCWHCKELAVGKENEDHSGFTWSHTLAPNAQPEAGYWPKLLILVPSSVTWR